MALAQAVMSKQPNMSGTAWEGVTEEAKDLLACVCMSACTVRLISNRTRLLLCPVCYTMITCWCKGACPPAGSRVLIFACPPYVPLARIAC